MSFNESNTVEQMILDAVENLGRTIAAEPMHDAPGWAASLARCGFKSFAKSNPILRY